MLYSEGKLMSACSLAQTLADAALGEDYPVHVRDTAQMICNLISEAMDPPVSTMVSTA